MFRGYVPPRQPLSLSLSSLGDYALMKTLLLLLVSILALNASGCRAYGAPWKRANVYLVGWDVETRVSLTPDRVRALADSKHSYQADVHKVVEALDLTALHPAKDAQPEDARLVVDLFDDAGQRTTYYASRFDLCTADNVQKHPISEALRHHFQTLAK